LPELSRILKWVIGVPLALFVIVFAISNRQRVALRFDPFTTGETMNAVEMPLWLLFFFGLAIGIVIGWVASWWAQGKHRKRAREAQMEVARLQAERQELVQRAAVKAEAMPAQNIVPVGTGIGPGWI
jgi:uncharacterized integral membrane protein